MLRVPLTPRRTVSPISPACWLLWRNLYRDIITLCLGPNCRLRAAVDSSYEPELSSSEWKYALTFGTKAMHQNWSSTSVQKRICRLTHMRPSTFESFWTNDAKERVDRQDSQGTEQAVAVDFQPFRIPSSSPKCCIRASKFNVFKIYKRPTT